MSKHQFQTEVSDLLNLMIHSLYSNKEIFLRELISNASDALDKLNYLTLTDDAYKTLEFSPKIEISLDSEKKILTIKDNGIGMDKDELIKNLGTIARSGTKGFLSNLSGDAKRDSNLIGQFGVGFYSAFMVADEIKVTSKKPLSSESYTWISDTKDFSVSEAQKEEFGTEIVLKLRDDEFASTYRLENIIKKYSNHIPYPIFMEKELPIPAQSQENGQESEQKEPKTELKFEQVNRASALWQMQKSAIKQADYDEFYKQISHDSNAPLMHIHTKAEGSIEYTTLFFVPSVAPFDLYRMDYESGVKLYVKRVFITDDEKELLPTFLRFVRGIMDVEDLPLNVSREILQDNRILRTVKDASVRKILGELKKLLENDREKYIKFYKIFGKVLKEGLYGFSPYRDEILNLLMFKSLKDENFITLAEYKSAFAPDQKEIFYITGSDEIVLRSSPLLESFKKKDINVLICDDEVDAVVIPMVFEFDGCKLENVANAENDEVKDENLNEILAIFKSELKDSVKDVRFTARLNESASCLVFDKNDPDFAMQQIYRQMGQDLPEIKPILELNPTHEIIQKTRQKLDAAPQIAQILLNLAKISEGMAIENPSEFAKILNKFIAAAL